MAYRDGRENTVVLYDSKGDELGVRQENPLVVTLPESSLTPYGVVRTEEDQTLLDLVLKYKIPEEQLAFDTASGGTITHIPEFSGGRLAVDGTNGSLARMRTHEYFQYFAGRASVVRQILYHPDGGQTNQVRRWGHFDDNDGLFWKLDGTSLSISRRTSTSGSMVESVVAAQADWNRDRLDGTGPSGVTLDITKANIYEIQLQWYGTGSNLKFYIDQTLVHIENFSNRFAAPWSRTAHLPVQWEIRNTAATTAGQIEVLGSSFEIMGKAEIPELNFGIGHNADFPVSNTETALLGLRPTLLFNGVENRVRLVPTLAEASSDGGNAIIRLYWLGSLSGGNWLSPSPGSHAEYNLDPVGFTAGELVYVGFITNGSFKSLPVGQIFSARSRSFVLQGYAGTRPEIVFTAEKLKAGSTDMRMSVNWSESV